MKTNAGLKAATVQYAKTRPVFEQYKATKYSRKFLAEHEADIEPVSYTHLNHHRGSPL